MKPTLIALLLVALLPTGLAAAAKLSAPRSARVGDTIATTAKGLEPGRYSLRLVSDDRPPGTSAFCAARIAGPRHTTGRRVHLTGAIPRKLTCWENNSVRLGKVKVTPGNYHLLVSVQRGPTGSDGKHSFARRALKIKR